MSDAETPAPESHVPARAPTSATRLTATVAKTTAFVLLLAGLLFALGKLGEGWQSACKALGVCPEAKHQWVNERVAELSGVIDKDTEFKFPHLSGAGPGQPQVGNERYDDKPVKAECFGGVPILWKLPNGGIVHDDDPLIRNGWSSSSYVGEPPGPDLARFDAEAMSKIGWSPGFYAHNMCPFAQHCVISAADVQAHSGRMEYPSEDCQRMGVVETNRTGADLSVWVRGTPRYAVKWTLKAGLSAYR